MHTIIVIEYYKHLLFNYYINLYIHYIQFQRFSKIFIDNLVFFVAIWSLIFFVREKETNDVSVKASIFIYI